MSRIEVAIDRARGLLLEAAFDDALWPDALDAVARACGARSGQLIGLDDQGAISAHWLTGVPDGFVAEVEAFGLANPVVNPRIRIGAHAPLLTPVADQDHVDAETRARHPIYAEIFDRRDVPFNCQAVVLREPGRLVRMSVSRTRGQGPLETDDFRAFSALAPHVRAAVRFQAELGAAGTASMIAAMDAMTAAAFVLDGSGRVIGASAEGERLAAAGEVVRVAFGRLQPAVEEDRPAFHARVDQALSQEPHAGGIAGPAVPARSRLGGAGVLFDIQPLPSSRRAIGRVPAALVVARQAASPADRHETLKRAFRLTEAEAAVALHLADGASLETISETRGVSVATVRSQIQSVYAKLGVHRQAQLVAAVRNLA